MGEAFGCGPFLVEVHKMGQCTQTLTLNEGSSHLVVLGFLTLGFKTKG